MHLLILIILALALSVPVGSALATFGGLVLEFILGLLVETAEKTARDPHKKQVATVVLVVVLGGAVLCLGLACVAVAWIVMANLAMGNLFRL